MKSRARPGVKFGASITKRPGLAARALMHGRWTVRCIRPDGSERWSDTFDNLVVNEGLDHLLDVTLSNATQVNPWYIGLLAATPSPAAGWVAANLAAVDFVDYDEATLPSFGDNAVSSQSVANGTTADFSINADSSTIGGAYLISTSAKATPAGTLYAAGAFTGGNKAADSGDTLQVTATFTAADDGV